MDNTAHVLLTYLPLLLIVTLSAIYIIYKNALPATKTFTIEKAYRWLVRYFYFVAYAQCAIDAFDEGKDKKINK